MLSKKLHIYAFKNKSAFKKLYTYFALENKYKRLYLFNVIKKKLHICYQQNNPFLMIEEVTENLDMMKNHIVQHYYYSTSLILMKECIVYYKQCVGLAFFQN